MECLLPIRGPLEGVTVVDLSRVLAGPYCSLLLLELGARVIKVESPQGDDAREYGPFLNGKSAYFNSYNRGKESIALDLKEQRDIEILHGLLSSADVLLENFRPGVMEKLGLSWEAVHARHPKLIYASISGFGQTGPLSQFPAYDMVVQGMSGLMSITGEAGRQPVRVGVSIGDIAAGMYTAVAVNAALYHRGASGKGARIDVAMFDCQVALMDSPIVRCAATGELPGPLGSRHPNISPFEAYATADAPLIIAAGNNRLFEKLACVLGLPELVLDPRFVSNEQRAVNVAELAGILEERLTKHSRGFWMEVLDRAEIPHAPINNVKDLLGNEQVHARNMLVTLEDEQCGTVTATGNPMKFPEFADPAIRRGAPRHDEHRNKLLSEMIVSGASISST